MPDKPKGILRNAPTKYRQNNGEEFDRHKVLENTLANAKLHEAGAAISHSGNEIRSNVEQQQSHEDTLQWDEAKLYLDEQERTPKMKIDEPKTPYQGAIGSSEYYREDVPEDEQKSASGGESDIEGFTLGEPEVSPKNDFTVENDRIEVLEEYEAKGEEEEEEEEEPSPEEKHRRFEEMRKAHYFMKGVPLKKAVDEEDDDEIDNEEDENKAYDENEE